MVNLVDLIPILPAIDISVQPRCRRNRKRLHTMWQLGAFIEEDVQRVEVERAVAAAKKCILFVKACPWTERGPREGGKPRPHGTSPYPAV